MSTTPYDVITDRIIAKLEAGTVPWVKPWQGQEGQKGRRMMLHVAIILELPDFTPPFFWRRELAQAEYAHDGLDLPRSHR